QQSKGVGRHYKPFLHPANATSRGYASKQGENSEIGGRTAKVGLIKASWMSTSFWWKMFSRML
ncbi:hypothetical protein, partial [Desulfogranum marinum]|uniref:hypothetical protein n=1 Tax=Desulfogranum marinum TaxID=453220 RepID=UPI001E4BCE14